MKVIKKINYQFIALLLIVGLVGFMGWAVNSAYAEEIQPETSATTENTTDSDIDDPVEQEMADFSSTGTNILDRNEINPENKLNIKAEEASGSLNYGFPIDLPTGRNSLQPSLILNYNNQDNEKLNQFGDGWSLNIPNIKRINKKGSDNLYTEHYFSSSLSGELKLVSSSDGLHGQYQAEVENGDFWRYELTVDNYWQVTDKQGIIYTFGLDTYSRQDNPSDNSQIYQWLLTEIRDTNDNYIKYEYFKDSGQIYPNAITYTGYEEVDGIFTVNFVRELREDNLEANTIGFNVVNNYRVSEIIISINDEWVKKYELDYGLGNNNHTSFLDTILESAKDKNNNISSLPINDFDYQETDKGFTLEENYEFPLYFIDGDGDHDHGVRLYDVNGDSLVDIIQSYYSGNGIYEYIYKGVYINDGTGHWNLDETYDIPVYFIYWYGSDFRDQGVRLADINGDSLIDIIRSLDIGSIYKEVYINNGHGWDLDENYDIPVYFSRIDGSDYTGQGAELIDVNGDNLADIIKSYYINGYIFKEAYINDGTGHWNLDETYDIPLYFDFVSGSNKVDQGVELADINGDNLVDMLRSYYQRNSSSGVETIIKQVYINDGTGHWNLDETYDIPLYFYYYSGSDVINQAVRFIDINKDNLIDLVRADNDYPYKVYINNGHGWDLDENYVLPLGFYNYDSGDLGVRLDDADGDDIIDLFQGIHLYYSGENHYIKEVYSSNAQIEFLSTIKTSQGVEININYQPSTQYKDVNNNLLNPNLPFVIQTVKQISIDDGMGNIITTDYKYHGGEYYYDNPDKRKFAGFSQVEKTIGDKKTITYYHQGNNSNTSQGENDDSYYKIGKPYRQEVYNNVTDTLLSQTVYKWDEYDQGYGNKFVYNSQKTNANFIGTTKSTASEYQYDMTNGNLLIENNLGEVTINTGTGEITNILSGDEKDTDYDYAVNVTKHILSAPKTKTISDSVDSKQQDIYYNNQAYGQVDKVNPTKEDYIEDNVEINRNFNSYGLVYEQSDPKNLVTTINYDNYNLYPSAITDPLNNTIYTEYNLLNGQVATTTSPNGAMTINTYDAFGRIVEIKISDSDNPTNLIVKQEISYQDTTLPRYKQTKNYFDTNSYVTSREYYDGLDRIIQTKNQTANMGEYATVDISYDSQGRVERQSLPYITTTIDYSTPNLSQPAKTYTYDALDRVLTETTPVGTTSYDYYGFTTIITDANGSIKELTKDAYGNLVAVKEHNDSNTYTTTYEYSLTNKLEKITDSQGNIRNFHYDSLDNLDFQDMVHIPSATSTPVINYTHDKNGNVLTENSFKGDNISYVYDDLNRVLYEKLDGTNKISYTYDLNNDIGQLSYIEYAEGNSRAYDYDILGRLRHSTTTIEGEAFVMHFDYNLNGDIESITYPNGFVVTYAFNDIGQIDSVSLDKGVGSVVLVENIEYNQNGQMTHLERSNGVNTNYTYYPQENFRLTDLVTTNGTMSLQDIHYDYDNVGNIIQITDNSDTNLAKIIWYDYDDLNRLASSTVSYGLHPQDNYSLVYNYDSIGNMTYHSGLGIFDYSNNNPHQLTGYGSTTFAYDNAGNTLDNDNTNFYWDRRNRLYYSQDIASSDKTYYEYDHNNQRLLKYTNHLVWVEYHDPKEIAQEANKEITANRLYMATSQPDGYWTWRRVKEDKYVDSYFEQNKSNQNKTHIMLNGVKIATVNHTSDPYFILGDHLNSSSILVDSSGVVAEMTDYEPYGKINYEQIITNLASDYTFTGKEYDEENGLQYYGARYLDNNVAKFTSVDPVMLVLHDGNQLKAITGQELQKILSDPQSLNSYAYSRNNPIILIDADGNWWKEVFTGKQSISDFRIELGQAAQQLYDNGGMWQTAMDHPYATGAVIGVGTAGAAWTAGALVSGLIPGSVLNACIAGCVPAAKAGQEATKLLNGPINITADRLSHVLEEHSVGGSNNIGRSIFNEGENIVNLIKQGTQQLIEKQSFGNNFQRVFDVGRNIGLDRMTNQQTSIMTVITNQAGNLITAFPGIPMVH